MWYGCAVALVECEIEVLSGSFAPWMLEKMKNNPYTKMPAIVPKSGVYTRRIFLCALYTLYSCTAWPSPASLVCYTIIYFLYHCTA